MKTERRKVKRETACPEELTDQNPVSAESIY